MKDFLSNKPLGDVEQVCLTEASSDVLQGTLPKKMKDPGSFTIPYTIGHRKFDRFLCDLGPESL